MDDYDDLTDRFGDLDGLPEHLAKTLTDYLLLLKTSSEVSKSEQAIKGYTPRTVAERNALTRRHAMLSEMIGKAEDDYTEACELEGFSRHYGTRLMAWAGELAEF